MSEQSRAFVAKLDAQHEDARNRVLRALTGEANAPQDVLLRWMLENNVSSYDVFTGWAATSFSTFEGMDSVMRMIDHALVDDGEISFVLCKASGPKIVFLDHRESGFRDEFLRSVQSAGHGDDVMSIFEPVGTVADVAEYIEAYEAHKAERNRWFEEHFGPE